MLCSPTKLGVKYVFKGAFLDSYLDFSENLGAVSDVHRE